MSNFKTRLAKLELAAIKTPLRLLENCTDEELFFMIFPNETEYRELTNEEAEALIIECHRA